MKILLYTDLHMCPRSSLISKWGTKYSMRLENCIKTVNWVEQTAEAFKCDYIINLGDFFDRPDLSSDTITACNELLTADMPHISLVGNHDASISSLMFNSVNRLASNQHKIICEPTVIQEADCLLCFLPYILECDRKPIKEYFPELANAGGKTRIILSHNDISGIQLGPVVSKTGFTIDEIEDSCDLFLNGHLHNGQRITNKIINLGNITGKDFGEDANKYSHNAVILDTTTLTLHTIENPHAFNFYKLNIDSLADIDKLATLKSNAVISIKCEAQLLTQVKDAIETNTNILEHRIIINRTSQQTTTDNVSIKDLQVDHLARFIDCCKSIMDNSSLLDEELAAICK